MADFSATPRESVGAFRAHGGYGPLWRYGGPKLAVVTPVNGARFGPHNLGTGLLNTTFARTGRWLRMDEPEGFDRIPDEVPARVRAAGALRSRALGK